jgi:hypothetical protein
MSEVKVNKISPRTNCGTTQLGDAGDTITVTGDLKSNSIKSASGSTITLGQSGDTIQLGCGASQTGFGRTGTVDWDTTAKTASFTAVSGNGYFVNTTSGAITMTLPASPSAGDIVAFKDYANTFDTNNLTVARNGSLIGGNSADAVISVEGQAITMVYVDVTRGWLATDAATDADLPSPSFITATGGTVTCCGDYKIHTFTGPGTFCVSAAGNAAGSNTVEILSVGAGGGGGGDNGGGGAGGSVANNPAVPVSTTGYPITIGSGGTGGLSPSPPSTSGGNGNTVTFFGNTVRGGSGGRGAGGAGGTFPGTYSNGGGGAGVGDGSPCATVAPRVCGVTHPTISGYTIYAGNNGGAGRNTNSPQNPGPGNRAGGGAGSGAVGEGGTAPGAGGAGGIGTQINICGSNYYWGGGGGGGTNDGVGGNGGNGGGGGGGSGPTPGFSGGTGGAGLNCGANGGGSPGGGREGGAGGANTGGGGGGSGRVAPENGGNGGSGIVIIKYKYQ